MPRGPTWGEVESAVRNGDGDGIRQMEQWWHNHATLCRLIWEADKAGLELYDWTDGVYTVVLRLASDDGCEASIAMWREPPYISENSGCICWQYTLTARSGQEIYDENIPGTGQLTLEPFLNWLTT